MLKLKKKGMTDVGFMDPNRTFKDMVTPYNRWRLLIVVNANHKPSIYLA